MAFLLAACHPEHGRASFQVSPFPVHGALDSTNPQTMTPAIGLASRTISFFAEPFSCTELPRCGFQGGRLDLAHVSENGTLVEADSGRYQVVSRFSAADGGVELREATVSGFNVSPSSSGSIVGAGSGASEAGCNVGISTYEQEGIVEVVVLDGGVLTGHLDTPRWQGSFTSEHCER